MTVRRAGTAMIVGPADRTPSDGGLRLHAGRVIAAGHAPIVLRAAGSAGRARAETALGTDDVMTGGPIFTRHERGRAMRRRRCKSNCCRSRSPPPGLRNRSRPVGVLTLSSGPASFSSNARSVIG